MTNDRHRTTVRHIHTLYCVGVVGGLTDGELLERLTARSDDAAEPAFAALVDRHGPMVLRVCRQVLRDSHDAEDAFQATFLVLVRKARLLTVRDSLGPWLHGVAVRVASCARAAERRRRGHERRAGEMKVQPVVEAGWNDLDLVLHEEIERLPARYRAPIVLCYLVRTMLLTKIKVTGAVLLSIGTIMAGAGVLARQESASTPTRNDENGAAASTSTASGGTRFAPAGIGQAGSPDWFRTTDQGQTQADWERVARYLTASADEFMRSIRITKAVLARDANAGNDRLAIHFLVKLNQVESEIRGAQENLAGMSGLGSQGSGSKGQGSQESGPSNQQSRSDPLFGSVRRPSGSGGYSQDKSTSGPVQSSRMPGQAIGVKTGNASNRDQQSSQGSSEKASDSPGNSQGSKSGQRQGGLPAASSSDTAQERRLGEVERKLDQVLRALESLKGVQSH